jgi:hypothetical protein
MCSVFMAPRIDERKYTTLYEAFFVRPAVHSRSASASSIAFKVSSTLPRTTLQKTPPRSYIDPDDMTEVRAIVSHGGFLFGG